MTFLIDHQELKPGLIIFKRSDVRHRNWYCRIKVPNESRYKTISLKTSDINEAREKAFDHDADIRFRVRHNVPVFDKSFADVAAEYSQFQKTLAETGQITLRRWKNIDGHIRLHLIPYVGNMQITHLSADAWQAYALWRRQDGKDPERGPPRDGTLRQEMMTFRAILNYAADKHYIRERQVPKGRLPQDKARREEFTPQEYRQLHRYARRWIADAKYDLSRWYRTMVYNFMLVMTNTGMRTIEARNLRWRDIDVRTDPQGRRFVCINVRGKDKFRELVAAANVADYLERIRTVSKATAPDDHVFTMFKGKPASTLYQSLIEDLLTKSELLHSASGSRRSSYCFRHTYATFRLTEGVDVYFLAKQMGTSVKMIEDYYGHITPAKNAAQILQGIPGWEPAAKSASKPDRPRARNGSAPKARPATKPRRRPARRRKGAGEASPETPEL